MSSNLSCIGFEFADADDFQGVLSELFWGAKPIARVGGMDIVRWEDSSGARLVAGLRNGEVVDFVPSFAGRPGVRLENVTPGAEDALSAAVVDEAGEQTTAMSFELEQQRLLPRGWSGPAAVTAFGLNAEFFRDADDFTSSPRSLLDPSADADDPAPEGYRERGPLWPPRVAEESFFSWSEASARLSGVVLTSERRRNVTSGRDFLAARVRCLGFEMDLVTDHSVDDPPEPGSIVTTNAFLVASIDELWAGGGKRSWFRRRR